VTAWVTFVPCFLFVLLGAPYAEHLRGRPGLRAGLESITAAVVGVVLNLAVWFSIHTLFGEATTVRAGPLQLLTPAPATLDVVSLLLALASGWAMLKRGIGMIPTLGVAAIVGLAIHLLVG
jgi:chromate transporter